MRKKIKLVDVTGFTAVQIENGMNTALTKGWEFVQAIVVNTKTFIILQKTISN